MKFKDTIGVFPKAFTKNECKEIIKLFENKIASNEAIQGYSSSGQDNSKKKTTDFNLFNASTNEEHLVKDSIIAKFNHYLSEEYLSKYPHGDIFDHNTIVNGKTFYPALNLQKYNKNEGHYNAWHTEKDHFAVSSRIFVFILYLNDVSQGGQTRFLFKEEGKGEFFGVEPEAGKLIIHPASWPYIHMGEMPVSNDKYIATTWLQYGDW